MMLIQVCCGNGIGRKIMFRKIRKVKKELSIDAAKHLLDTERRGVLAVNGDDGYPYAIPINYLYCEDEDKIYFHGSHVGYKAESIMACDKVCFTVYGNETIKDEEWAPYVQSVVVFGKCQMIGSQDLNTELVKKFAEKYYPNASSIDEEVSKAGKAVQMYEIIIEHISGKEVQEK